ncbi:TRAP transporter substrate-binding protein DctP [Halotalea alkalilenta]|uniref:TRAP transporter substrate-binding protein DctP n=1 Tax=Halotalea alkalilenta TaxID=376489 RepID=UPI0012DCD7A5|nr:TRAP transporter substrate-binding protein DctP [Halotalea alkalilenta]
MPSIMFSRRALFGLMVLCAALFSFEARAATTLRLASQLPEAHALGQNLALFAERVEALSDGELRIVIYPSSQLYSDKMIPKAVGVGAIDMGIASLTQFAGIQPAVDLFYLPFLFEDQQAVLRAIDIDSPVRQRLDRALLETGTRVLWWQPYGSTVVMSHHPVRVPEDLAGRKVRVFGKTVGDFIEAIGAAPTLLSGAEQFLAYQRGTVDAGLSGILAIKSRRLYELMPHITLTRHADVEFVVLINDQRWRSLDDRQREVLAAAAREAELELRDQIPRLEREAEAFVAERAEVVELSDAERERWREASSPVRAAFLAQSGALGAELLEAVERINRPSEERLP